MDKEKFVDRVEGMIYSICGCSYREAREVLKECLRRNKEKLKNPKIIKREDYYDNKIVGKTKGISKYDVCSNCGKARHFHGSSLNECKKFVPLSYDYKNSDYNRMEEPQSQETTFRNKKSPSIKLIEQGKKIGQQAEQLEEIKKQLDKVEEESWK